MEARSGTGNGLGSGPVGVTHLAACAACVAHDLSGGGETLRHQDRPATPYTMEVLTPERWPALEDLFGRAGASNGCWCMYWRMGLAYSKRPREENRRAFREVIDAGPPPGILAFDGDLAVGWCQLTPRNDLPWLEQSRVGRRPDDLPVWSLSCFYVRRGYRGQGVALALIAEATRVAKACGACAVEAYPVDTAVPGHTRNVFTGSAKAFHQAGFYIVTHSSPSRPLMRYDLRTRSEESAHQPASD